MEHFCFHILFLHFYTLDVLRLIIWTSANVEVFSHFMLFPILEPYCIRHRNTSRNIGQHNFQCSKTERWFLRKPISNNINVSIFSCLSMGLLCRLCWFLRGFPSNVVKHRHRRFRWRCLVDWMRISLFLILSSWLDLIVCRKTSSAFSKFFTLWTLWRISRSEHSGICTNSDSVEII